MQEMIKPYFRQAKYYETDQMAVVHHSNYIRWFEEARVDFLEQIGLGYDKIEAAGVYSPVLAVSCEYKSSVRFHETVLIKAILRFFNGIKMKIEYQGMMKCVYHHPHSVAYPVLPCFGFQLGLFSLYPLSF